MSGFFSSYVQLPDITISNAGTKSGIVNGIPTYHDAAALFIQSPSTLPETVTIYAHPSGSITDPADALWMPLESYDSGALATVSAPTVAKGRVYSNLVSVGSFMLVSGSAVAADRVFKFGKYYTA